MYDKAHAWRSQVQTHLLFNRPNFLSHRQSCEFPVLFLSLAKKVN